ncbi:MAG TPA: RNA polymerase Rpb4 family protein [Candidatus Thermoplasmatota archaeon]|nr:RNA polymerase Rpb4 family protein [Candidatus Thermoplasmatota archaeon]
MATSTPERVVPLADVKELLEKAEAGRGELTYEQKLALEHARRFARFTASSAKQLLDELMQNPKVDLVNAIRVADLSPSHPDDVRAVFSKARVTLDEAEIQKILESVLKYASA